MLRLPRQTVNQVQEDAMRGAPIKALIMAGAMLTVALGAAVPAGAATAAPAMNTSDFACSGSVCEVGPGNVGVAFGAELKVTSGGNVTMKTTSGSLPPGLQLSLGPDTWQIAGTPTTAGTYPFTVQITPTAGGAAGAQQLTITVGTGSSDRIDLTKAIWSPHTVNKFLQIQGFDANIGATFTVSVTATGAKLGTFTTNSAFPGVIQNDLRVPPGPSTFTSFTNPGSVTVTDNLGGSATIAVTVNPKYS
jgi:large repetitive protein